MIDITEHLPLVEWRINRRWIRAIRGHIEREDLVQEGRLGLMRAAETFDPNNGGFTTYALYWVDNFIRRHLLKHGRLVRIPACAEHNKRFKWTPQAESLLYLDAPRYDDRDATNHERVGRADPALALSTAPLDVARLLLFVRSEHHRIIVREYYIDGRTLKSIGDEHRLSRERIRQILVEARASMGEGERRRRVVEPKDVPAAPLPPAAVDAVPPASAPEPPQPQPAKRPRISLGSKPERTSEAHLAQRAKASERLRNPEVQARMRAGRACFRGGGPTSIGLTLDSRLHYFRLYTKPNGRLTSGRSYGMIGAMVINCSESGDPEGRPTIIVNIHVSPPPCECAQGGPVPDKSVPPKPNPSLPRWLKAASLAPHILGVLKNAPEVVHWIHSLVS